MLGIPRILTRRRFLTTAGTVVAGLGFYAWGIEPHWVEVVEHPLPIRDLPSPWQGRRVVQLSDIHVGFQVDPDYLRSVIRGVEALRPDMTVITGDFTTVGDGGSTDDAARLMAELRPGPLGALAILGNHDYGYRFRDHHGADRLVGLLREVEIPVLRNEIHEIDGLQFVGIDDMWGTNFDPRRALKMLDRDRPSLVLCHNPDVADLSIWKDYRGWMLSGHTHGGQVKPPFLPAPILPTKNKRYIAGDYDVGPDRRLYINRGVGHLLRLRCNARPEVTVHTLTRA
jgi:predicted MPP superfamily phosphohydrolase